MYHRLFYIVTIIVCLFSCDREECPYATHDSKVQEVSESTDIYTALSDSIKAMGLRGDMDGARGMLRTFQKACIEGKESRITAGQSAEAKKMLFISWGNVISFLFNNGDILDAVDEVQAMQKFAEDPKDEFGIAMVELSYGGLYTYSFKESIEHLRRALSYWEKTQNVPQMQYTYYMLSRELLGQAENADSASLDNQLYDEVLKNSNIIQQLDTTNVYMKQVSEYQKLMVYVALKDKEAAKECYDTLNEWWQKGEVAPQLKGMLANTMAQYLVTFDNPSLATSLLKEINIPIFKMQTERLHSVATGDYHHAYQLQSQIDKQNIQRINQLQQNQLAIANAAFNNLQLERANNQLEMERMERERWLILVSIALVALFIVIFVLLMHQRTIGRKNRELVKRIKDQEETDKRNLNLTVDNAEKLTQTEQLYLRIKQLLQDEAVLSDPELGRDMIASKLATNRTYVAKAISECADGKSVSGYINELRVKMGLRMLEDPQKSIEEIAQACGFSSRSHFHNLFVAQYGMTPAQFRKTLKKL